MIKLTKDMNLTTDNNGYTIWSNIGGSWFIVTDAPFERLRVESTYREWFIEQLKGSINEENSTEIEDIVLKINSEY